MDRKQHRCRKLAQSVGYIALSGLCAVTERTSASARWSDELERYRWLRVVLRGRQTSSQP